MSDRFPNVTAKELIKIAQKLGFEFARQSGSSHAIYKRASDSRRTTIPVHGKKSIKRKTVKSICRDLEINIDELKQYLKD